MRRLLAILAARMPKGVFVYVLIALLLPVAGMAGVSMRLAEWDRTAPVRYVPDMRNAFNWGSRAADAGYVELYDRVAEQSPGYYEGLDYVPLRLAVMTWWVSGLRADGITAWENTWAGNRRLMMVNFASDGSAALLMWAWVWVVAARAGKTPHHAAALGLVAGSLLWLNPAVHVSGFGRPTWDVWVLPFTLGAALSATWRRWALSGALLAVGAMFKGQHLVTVPFFLAWALMAAGPRGVLSWVGGAAAAGAAVVSPWLFTVVDAGQRRVAWSAVAGAVAPALFVAGSVLLAARRPARTSTLAGVGVPTSAGAASRTDPWPGTGAGSGAGERVGTGAGGSAGGRVQARTGALGVALRSLAGPWGRTAVLLTLAVSMWAAPVLLSAPSFAWYDIAFVHGTQKFPQLEVGGSSALSGLLKVRYGWGSEDLVLGWVEMQQLLGGLYGLCAVLTGVFAGLHHRRNDARLLLALPTCWVCFFAFAPLMHERYLLWGAATLAAAVAVSWRLTALGLLLSVSSWAMTLRVMLLNPTPPRSATEYLYLGPNGREWLYLINPTFPDSGWAIMLAAGVLLVAVCSTRRVAPVFAARTEDRPASMP